MSHGKTVIRGIGSKHRLSGVVQQVKTNRQVQAEEEGGIGNRECHWGGGSSDLTLEFRLVVANNG